MERTPRKMPKEHKDIDMSVPVTFNQIGSDDDCFGKHYTIKAEECKRCGDCQLCAIVTAQQIHHEVKAIEQKSKFKDNEEAALMIKQNKRIATMLLKRAENKTGTWLSFSKIIPKLRELFNLTEVEDESVRQRCIKAAQETNRLVLNKDKTKYKL